MYKLSVGPSVRKSIRVGATHSNAFLQRWFFTVCLTSDRGSGDSLKSMSDFCWLVLLVTRWSLRLCVVCLDESPHGNHSGHSCGNGQCQSKSD